MDAILVYTQCECLKNKCESRSAKRFSVRTTEQMVCICIFYFLEVVQLSGEVLCYVICDFLLFSKSFLCHFILCSLISEN